MSSDLGWSRTQIVMGLTIGGIVSSGFSPLLGRMLDKHGVKPLMVPSAVVGGAALISIAFIHNLWEYYLLFGIVFGLARPAVQQLGPTTALANWFIRNRARAMALATVGVPIAGIIGIPLTQSFISQFGWRGAWSMLGVFFMVLIAIPAMLWLKTRPEDIGLHPDGEEPSKQDPKGTPQTVNKPRFWIGPSRVAIDWTPKAALKTKAFWLLILAGDLMTVAAPSMALHVTPYFSDLGLAPAAAAIAATSFGIGTLIARGFWGLVAEHLHIQYCFVLIAIIGLLGMLSMLVFTTTPWAYFAVAFVGISGGGFFQLQMQIWPDYFGRKAIGAIRGFSTPFQTISITAGPLFVAWVHDQTGGYSLAFMSFAITSALGGLLMLFNPPPQPKQDPGEGREPDPNEKVPEGHPAVAGDNEQAGDAMHEDQFKIS